MADDGVSHFQLLQNALRNEAKLQYYAALRWLTASACPLEVDRWTARPR
jgi:hypothetical protein